MKIFESAMDSEAVFEKDGSRGSNILVLNIVFGENHNVEEAYYASILYQSFRFTEKDDNSSCLTT